MKNFSDALLRTLGFMMAVIAAWQFYLFVAFRDSKGFLETQGGTFHVWPAIVAAVLTCAFVGIFRRINQTEELHITS